MEIESFRIKNYRSIKDSGECRLSSDNITILAGKNESGKTSILEALEDFSNNKEIRENSVPFGTKKIPEIIINFILTEKELKKIIHKIGLENCHKNCLNITIVKKYPHCYSILSENIIELELCDCFNIEVENSYIQLAKELSPYDKNRLPPLNFQKIKEIELKIVAIIEEIKDSNIVNDDKKSDIIKKCNAYLSNLNKYNNVCEIFSKEIIDNYIPNFILFDSFNDIFPAELSLEEAKNNELIKDLTFISNLDFKIIESDSLPAKASHKSKINIELNEDYKKYWDQDLTDLSLDWENGKLSFLIKEGDYHYPPYLRSKGKLWHLAFYVKVTARLKENVQNVILLDEPGIYLHAIAQKDIIRKLEDSAKKTEIIYSTQSPYLIKPNKLSRIRLVYRKNDNGTIICNKIHKGPDKESLIETLTPIITAIGLDLSLGLDVSKNNNILLEGITDYYYLSAFIKLLDFKFKEEVHFIPSTGADNIVTLISLMIGWRLNYCALLDNDKKGKEVYEKVVKKFEDINLKVISISNTKDDQIEDIFEREDFHRYVLCEKTKSTFNKYKTNSHFAKQNNEYSKITLAKSFYDNIINGENIKLSDTTTNKIEIILENIDKTLFSESEIVGKVPEKCLN